MKHSAISNAIWMMSEKIVSVFGVIFVTSYVAKSFGPTVFGQMAFSVSLFSVVQTVAIFGTETLLFKQICKSVQKGMRLMNVTRKMRMRILLMLSLPVLLWVGFTMPKNFFVFALAAFLAALFVTQDIFSVYNNALLASRLNTIANSVGMLLSFAISFSIAGLRLNPLWLTFSIVAAAFVPYLIKRYMFYQRNTDVHLSPKENKTYSRYLLYAGLPLAISGIFISIQVKATQFFLVGVGSAQDLGLFAAANTIAASWIFIPLAIITSCFSGIFREKSEVSFILTSRLNGYAMIVSLLMFLIVSQYGETIIMLLYGKDYTQSGSLITLLSMATCCSAMGTVAYRYIIKEGGFHYLLIKIICLMLVSLPLSYGLINLMGLMGAAWGVFITELLSLTVMNYFFKNGIIQKMQIQSLNYKTYKRGLLC